MGKRPTSKHAASALAAGARLRRLLVAAVCGGLMLVASGLLLSVAEATRLLLALGTVVVVYAGLVLAKGKRAKGGRRRAVVAVPVVEDEEPAEPSFVDGGIEIFGSAEGADEPVEDVDKVKNVEKVERLDEADAEIAELLDDLETIDLIDLIDDTQTVDLVEDTETVELLDDADDAEPAQDEDEPKAAATDAEFPPMPARLLEQLMQQAMAEQLAKDAAQDDSEEQLPALTAEAERTDADLVVPEVVTHDLVPISSLHEARAEAEQLSLQRLRATVRGIGVRTGDDPVAADVLARVVAAVDRLTVSDSSFARPALSETGPLLAAAAAAPQEAALPAQEATPLPAVPTMRPSDMPVTELSAPVLPATTIPDEAPAPTPATDTRPIDAVVVEDPDLVLPIPAPPKPPPAPRGRRLRRKTVA